MAFLYPNYQGANMIIFVDLDNVLADTSAHLLAYYNEIAQTDHELEDFCHHNIGKQVMFSDIVDSFWRSENIMLHIPVVEGSVQAMKQLLEQGHEVYIASAIEPKYLHSEYMKREWLRRFFPFFPQDNVIFIRNKSLLSGDVIIDDYIENLIKSPCLAPILFGQPYNDPSAEAWGQKYLPPAMNRVIPRIFGWEAVMQYLKDYDYCRYRRHEY
jgi:5'(3')-deoxyribonucleotidase